MALSISPSQPADPDLNTWAGITPAANVGTFLTTPSSANLAAAMTDETGTGSCVFATSPALTTPTGIDVSDIGNAEWTTGTASTVPKGVPFVVFVSGVNLKAAATTTVFTVPAAKNFMLTSVQVAVTAVTAGGAGTLTAKIRDTTNSKDLTQAAASASQTPVANVTSYPITNTTGGGTYQFAPASAVIGVVVSTSNAGSTAVTGTVFVTGFYF
jgi:hypothetical protein